MAIFHVFDHQLYKKDALSSNCACLALTANYSRGVAFPLADPLETVRSELVRKHLLECVVCITIRSTMNTLNPQDARYNAISNIGRVTRVSILFTAHGTRAVAERK